MMFRDAYVSLDLIRPRGGHPYGDFTTWTVKHKQTGRAIPQTVLALWGFLLVFFIELDELARFPVVVPLAWTSLD